MLKAVIFDLNGIFFQGPKLSERFEQAFGVPESRFRQELFGIMEKVRHPGAGRAFAYWEPALKEWGVNLTEQEFWDFWFKGEKAQDKMVEIARAIRARGIKVFILSNNFKERSEYYGHYPWLHEAVDKVYFSWQTGYVKPDLKAWSTLLEEHRLKPEECIYFDDQEKNLKAAESLGIEAHMFAGEEALTRTIEDFENRHSSRETPG